MSRCFPYPPPGYVRNPVAVAVAVAESTAKNRRLIWWLKLQKERGKAEKKKEKRSDKKAFHQGETSKHSKHSHKKRKHEEPKKVSNESVEQLEKSGLSEEHGAPCFTQTVHDSPESSQDSSKRRKVVLPSPSQAKSGNILRIKIRSNQVSPASDLEKPRALEQPLVQQIVSSSTLLGKQNSIQSQNKLSVKSTAAPQQRIDGGSQAVQKQVSTQLPAKFMRRDDSQTTAKAPVRSAGLPAKMSESVVHPAVRVMGRVDPPPAKVTRRVEAPPAMVQRVNPQLPSDIQRKCPPASAKLMQETSTSEIHQLEVPQPPRMWNPKVELPVMKQPIASVPKEEPCSSGRNVEAVPAEAVKQSRSDRKKSHKAEKEEKKFRDLFVTWNPLSLEMESSDVGAQDWLLGSTRNSDATMTKCRASDGLVPFQSMEQQPSLQPRATFLPDLHIYQLPFVVPF